jgi:formamidopyrimidine-DNA glycosylase
MPELPEVETVRLGLAPFMQGARILSAEANRGDLRWPLQPDFTRRLQGQTIQRLTRRGKYLLAELSSGEVLIMHLGMSGSFRVAHSRGTDAPGRYHHPHPRHPAHDHVKFQMSSGATILFNDPRRFGMMKLIPGAEIGSEPLLRALGPEPLGDEFNAAVLAGLCRGKTTSLKAALLDQRIVAGLGNIYVCEALHGAELSPRRHAATIATRSGLPNPRTSRLVASIRTVLRAAITAGGSSLRDHRRTDGALGDFQHKFRVYDRAGEACRRAGCGGIVKRIVQAGRSTFFCPTCQK